MNPCLWNSFWLIESYCSRKGLSIQSSYSSCSWRHPSSLPLFLLLPSFHFFLPLPLHPSSFLSPLSAFTIPLPTFCSFPFPPLSFYPLLFHPLFFTKPPILPISPPPLHPLSLQRHSIPYSSTTTPTPIPPPSFHPLSLHHHSIPYPPTIIPSSIPPPPLRLPPPTLHPSSLFHPPVKLLYFNYPSFYFTNLSFYFNLIYF